MAYKDPNVLRDGWTNTLGGTNSGRATNLLAPNELAFSVNASLRGGYPETRPPFVKPELDLELDSISDWWAAHEAQGADYFAPADKNPLVVVSIGGRLFQIDVLDDFRVSEFTPKSQTTTVSSFISPPQGTTVTVTVTSANTIQVDLPVTIGDGIYTVTAKANNVLTIRNETATAGVSVANPASVNYLDANPNNLPQAWMEQADKWLIVQDGKSAAVIYDGSLVRRVVPQDQEVPTGTVMVFNEEIGRLCVAVPNNEIAVGDITNVLKFTETGYLHEGGRFKVPRKFGRITGACMLANQDRSNGQGAMLFFTERGITAFNLPAARDTWKSLPYPPQINMPIKGAASHGGIALVNGDAFYRAKDGLRSFALTRAEFGTWGNTPVSRELGRVLDADDQKLLTFGSAALFDNRLLFTVGPQPGRHSAYHRGLGVLDFEGVSSMGQKARPRYDGIWTGIQPTHLVVGDFGGEERCFAFTRGEDGGVEFWEILRKGNFDGDDGRIVSWIETRALFGSSDRPDSMELKSLQGFEMWIDRISGTVDFDLKYRPDMYPCWFDWDTKQVCQKYRDCVEDVEGCKTVTTYRQGYRSRQAFGQPPDNTDEHVDNKPARNGYMFELRLQWTGRARIKWGLAKAHRIPEDTTPQVATTES